MLYLLCLRFQPEKYKTKLCAHYASGYCSHGDGCAYAHGSHELRPSNIK